MTQAQVTMTEPQPQKSPDRRRYARPDSPVITKVSIVIPVYNEEATVQHLIRLVVAAALPEGVTREIICVNDCSKDRTAAKLDELPKLHPETEFKIFHKPVNE